MNEKKVITVIIAEEFGSFCAEGSKAFEFLEERILPEIEQGNQVVLDFQGVRNMNSSFANALFANLVRKLEGNLQGNVVIHNAKGNVQAAIKMGLSLGKESLEK